MGVTVPGIPFLLFSRSEHIMHSITYGFMDMVDFFIEEVKRYKKKKMKKIFEKIRKKKLDKELFIIHVKEMNGVQ